jgi:hypothetical protein
MDKLIAYFVNGPVEPDSYSTEIAADYINYRSRQWLTDPNASLDEYSASDEDTS